MQKDETQAAIILNDIVKKRSSSCQKNFEKYYNILNFFDKFKKDLSVKVSRLHYLMFAEFKSKLEEKLRSLMKIHEYENVRFSLFFILYKYENIRNYDDSLLLEIFPELERKKVLIFCMEPNMELSGYFSKFIEIRNQIKGEENNKLTILCVFNGILNISNEEISLLIRCLEENIFNQYRSLRFFFIFQTFKTSSPKSFLFEKRDIFVDRLFFEQTGGYFYKFLYQIIKTSILPNLMFSPDFIQNIVKNYFENIIPLDEEIKKWIKFHEIHLIIKRSLIFCDILNFKNKILEEAVNLSNRKFKIGLKILILVLKKIFNIEREDLICKYIICFFCEKDFSFTSIIENHKVLDNRLELINIFDKFWKKQIIKNNLNNDKQIKKIFEKINENLNKKQPPQSKFFSNNNKKIMSSKEDRDAFILQRENTKKEANINLFKTLDLVFVMFVKSYYNFVSHNFNSYLINNYMLLDNYFNPDFQGKMIKKMVEINNKDNFLFLSSKIFFDLLKNEKNIISLGKFYSGFYKSLKDSGFVKNNKNFDQFAKNLFIYNQQLFDHFGMIKLNFKNKCTIRKLFFGKAN